MEVVKALKRTTATPSIKRRPKAQAHPIISLDQTGAAPLLRTAVGLSIASIVAAGYTWQRKRWRSGRTASSAGLRPKRDCRRGTFFCSRISSHPLNGRRETCVKEFDFSQSLRREDAPSWIGGPLLKSTPKSWVGSRFRAQASTCPLPCRQRTRRAIGTSITTHGGGAANSAAPTLT